MRKCILLLLIPMLSVSLLSQAQLRHGSCASSSQSRFYITPYIAAGVGMYSYDLNKTTIGPAPDSINYPSSKGMLFTPGIGLNLMYKIGKSNIGGGAEWQGMYGNTVTDISSYNQEVFFYKFYGRFEYAIYTDPFSDFGIYLQGGISFPNNIVGENGDLGMFIGGGLFYNIILNSTSAIICSLDYEYATFTSTIGGSISHHKFTPIKLALGYRFWF